MRNDKRTAEAATEAASGIKTDTGLSIGLLKVGPLDRAEQLRCLAELERDAGRRYAGCRLDSFEQRTAEHFEVVSRCLAYVKEIEDRITGGNSLLLLGPVGTGKDHLAFAIARGAILRGYSAAWIDGLRWYALMRDRIQLGRLEGEAIYELLQSSLLVVSDPLPPTGDLSNYEMSNLLRIVHRRYIERKPTLLTANLADEAQGKDLIGDQAWDRLIEGAELLWCRWSSYRRKRVY